MHYSNHTHRSLPHNRKGAQPHVIVRIPFGDAHRHGQPPVRVPRQPDASIEEEHRVRQIPTVDRKQRVLLHVARGEELQRDRLFVVLNDVGAGVVVGHAAYKGYEDRLRLPGDGEAEALSPDHRQRPR